VQLALLTLAAAAALFARTSLGPMQETMRMALGLTDNQMALLQGPALALPVVFASVPLGLLIDRRVRARLVLAFLALSISGSVISAFSTSFAMLMAGRALVGLAAAATWIAALSLLADLYPPARRGRATMVVSIGAAGGMSAAFAAGGLLLITFAPSADAWRWATLTLAAPLPLIFLLSFALREPPRSGQIIKKPSARQAWTELWRHRSAVFPLIGGGVLLGIADGAALVWAAPALSRNFGLTAERVGALMGTALLINGIAGPIIGGLLADYGQRAGGPRRTMLVLSILALLSVPTALFASAPSVMIMTVLLVLFLMAGTALTVACGPLATVVLPNETRGLCIALMSATGQLFGFGFAPLTVSVLSGLLGDPSSIGQALSIVCVTMSLLGAAIFAVGSRTFPPRAIAAPS
jgi:MFS family permease